MTTNETVVLFRPVGQKERDLICESEWKRFPPRLAWQPIFATDSSSAGPWLEPRS